MKDSWNIWFILLVTFLWSSGNANAGEAFYSADDKKKIRVKDLRGKEWELNDWKPGSRSYKKNLIEREKAYQLAWGEDWCKEGNYRWSPGDWGFEEFAVIPDGKKAAPSIKKSTYQPWHLSQALVFSPGDGQQVSAVYALTKWGCYHIDPVTKATVFIGWKPSAVTLADYKGTRMFFTKENPTVLLKDGVGEAARLFPTRTKYGNWATVDPVSGRIYFEQRDLRDKRKGYVLRYIEKLLPYQKDGKTSYLPAILDYKKMYEKLGYTRVMENDKRAAPRLQVKTVKHFLKKLIPATFHWGGKVLLDPHGKVLFENKPSYPMRFNEIKRYDPATDSILKSTQMPARFPPGIASDRHHASCARFDDFIYTCMHTGSGWGPGKLFRFNTVSGKLQMLYDSAATYDPKISKRPPGFLETRKALGGFTNGPADATTLAFVTTCFQFQCPRTGAILHGGWDSAGLRRYHDGFVTHLASSPQIPRPKDGGRPEWKNKHVAGFGSLQSCPSAALNGDIYLTSRFEGKVFKDDLRINGIRVIRLFRKDWPKEQAVGGYTHRFLSVPEKEKRMLEYAKSFKFAEE